MTIYKSTKTITVNTFLNTEQLDAVATDPSTGQELAQPGDWKVTDIATGTITYVAAADWDAYVAPMTPEKPTVIPSVVNDELVGTVVWS